MKLYNQEQHDNLAEYLQRMQKPLGHHSWWYTNRSSEDCVNVKMHCWVDTEKVTKLLTEKERKAIEILHINVDEWCEEWKWRDIEIINECLLEDLQTHEKLQNKDCRIHALDYGGRSGGWLCVVFDFDYLDDWLEGYDYIQDLLKDGSIKKSEANTMQRQADKAVQYIELVHEHIKKMHKDLCKYYEQPEDYATYLSEYIADSIEEEAETIKTKADNLLELTK